MVLDISGGLFKQKDVRETPAGTATATSVGLTDGKYLVVDYHADMTDERKITAGEGIDFTDGGANSTLTIAGENASTTNKGIASFNTNHFTTSSGAISSRVSAGEGVDVSATQVISGENATTSNKGIASFNTNDFTVAAGAVSLKNKTSYVSITGSAFIPLLIGSAMGTDAIISSGKYTASQSALVSACIQIPNGAVITGAEVFGDDSGETWNLYRVRLSDGDLQAVAAANLNTEDTTITNATVDNSLYAYVFETSSLEANDDIYGARVKFTTDYI